MRFACLVSVAIGVRLAAGGSLSFEPNVGQAGTEMRFVAHSGSRTIVVTKSGVRLSGVELQFRGGSCAALSGVDPLAERHNYFRGGGRGRLTDIPTYGRVRCKRLYPGIGAEFYGDDASIECYRSERSGPIRESVRDSCDWLGHFAGADDDRDSISAPTKYSPLPAARGTKCDAAVSE